MSPTLTSPRRSSRKASHDPQELRYVQTLGFFAAKAGLTIEALADRTGISREKLTGMVRGRLPVSAEDALLLGRVLGAAPAELQSGPPGPVVSGSVLLDGAALTKADLTQGRYELGLEEAPPAAPTTRLRAAGSAADEMPERTWEGRTSWREVFGSQKCGWCAKVQDGPMCGLR